MPIGGMRSVNYLSEETCFRLWVELGSVAKVAKALEQDGVVNPETGKPPTKMGIWTASIRYMVKSTEEAREYLKMAADANPAYEFAFDDKTYFSWVKEKARGQGHQKGSVSKEDLESFLERYPDYATEDDWLYLGRYDKTR